MKLNVHNLEWLNERGNRSYHCNFVYPKIEQDAANNIFIVSGAIGPGVMYRGELVAEQIALEFVAYLG